MAHTRKRVRNGREREREGCGRGRGAELVVHFLADGETQSMHRRARLIIASTNSITAVKSVVAVAFVSAVVIAIHLLLYVRTARDRPILDGFSVHFPIGQDYPLTVRDGRQGRCLSLHIPTCSYSCSSIVRSQMIPPPPTPTARQGRAHCSVVYNGCFDLLSRIYQ